MISGPAGFGRRVSPRYRPDNAMTRPEHDRPRPARRLTFPCACDIASLLLVLAIVLGIIAGVTR
jgi:hypothetical protein